MTKNYIEKRSFPTFGFIILVIKTKQTTFLFSGCEGIFELGGRFLLVFLLILSYLYQLNIDSEITF